MAHCSDDEAAQGSSVSGTLSDTLSLQEQGSSELERSFQVLKDELVDGDWTPAAQAGAGSTSYMLGKGACWVRVTIHNSTLSYEDKIWALFPEIICEYDLYRAYAMEILQMVAPGDAIVRFGTLSPDLLPSLVALSGSLRCHARMSVRQDFPKPNATSLIFSPPDAGGPTPSPNFAMMFYFVTIEKIPDMFGFRVNHYIQLPWGYFPEWATTCLSHMLHTEAFNYRPDDTIFQEIKSFYVVLSLQSCSSGNPLLPVPPGAQHNGRTVSADGYAWRKASQAEEEFNFSAYLATFFEAIGHSIQVWESLGGRLLVPYQAVLRGSDWKRVSAAFQDMYWSQRKAFRKMYSSTTVPKIREMKKARYIDLWTTDVPSLEQSTLLEKNTFLTLSEGRRQPMVRSSAEYP